MAKVVLNPFSGELLLVPASGGGSGANQTLSNLTAPTAINADLLFDADAAYYIGEQAIRITGVYSNFFDAREAFVLYDDTNGEIGSLGYNSANADISLNDTLIDDIGNLYGVRVTTQNRIDSSNSKAVVVDSGGVIGGVSGTVIIRTGVVDGIGQSGTLSIYTGDSTQANGTGSGLIELYTGGTTDAASGAIGISTGPATDAASGAIEINSGSITGTGNSGSVLISTGNSASDDSGNIVLQTGTAGGTRGTISLNSGSNPFSSIQTGLISVTVPALAAGALGDSAATITGLTDGDFIFVTPANAGFEDGLTFSCYVSAADTLTINMVNNSGVTLAGSTSDWRYLIVKG